MSDKDVLNKIKYQSGHDYSDNEDYYFWCPGCDEIHKIRASGQTPVWTFNSDMINPTFTPSHLTGSKDFKEDRCHSFIKDGNIQFLNDCHHKLKGQTIRLPTKDKWRYGT